MTRIHLLALLVLGMPLLFVVLGLVNLWRRR